MAKPKPTSVEWRGRTITRELALMMAAREVRRMASYGYTSVQAKEEIMMGRGSRNDPGYEISHGKIGIPTLRDGLVFRFEDIEKSLRPLQQTLLPI